MQDILVQIGNYGFPMVVAVYLLVRVEKKLDALTGAINRLEQVLAACLKVPGLGGSSGGSEAVFPGYADTRHAAAPAPAP